MMFFYLLKHRSKPKIFSFKWFKAWAKRIFHIRNLLRIIVKNSRLTNKGAEIGYLSVVGTTDIHGNLSKLKIGKECFIGSNVHIALHDNVTLGNNVVINDGCKLLTGSHDINCPNWSHVKAPITIEDYAWIATSAILLPGVTIGRGAVVAAGAVVSKSIPPYHVAAGNPARLVKERELKQLSHVTVHWLAPIEAWTGIPQRHFESNKAL